MGFLNKQIKILFLHVLTCHNERDIIRVTTGGDLVEAKMQIRLPKEMYDKFKQVAADNSQVPSLLIRKWIENYIKKEDSDGPTI